MKYGVRNDLMATVKDIKKGEIMSQVECVLTSGERVASVLTTDSVEEMGLKAGDKIHLLVKAIHVVPAKD
ncbi:MAG: TOBE domain-containing protein [Pyramidobacter sp.]|jgi:molybdopterin-binding protein